MPMSMSWPIVLFMPIGLVVFIELVMFMSMFGVSWWVSRKGRGVQKCKSDG
jgi:hypothetical protein